jgi:hypothetical protein
MILTSEMVTIALSYVSDVGKTRVKGPESQKLQQITITSKILRDWTQAWTVKGTNEDWLVQTGMKDALVP